MILNLVELNGATTGSWLTGDVNGPTLRWAQEGGLTASTWTQATNASTATWHRETV